MRRYDYSDVEELAAFICGLDYDEIDADTGKIEDAMIEKFNCNLEDFANIITKLMPMVEIAESSLSKKWYAGFANKAKQMWLLKEEITA